MSRFDDRVHKASVRLPVVGLVLLLAIATLAFSGVASTQAGPSLQREADGPTIVGGEEAEPGAWPWQVALVTAGLLPVEAQYCGGVLLSRDWVVTAAHCAVSRSADTIQVWAGIHNLRVPEPGAQQLDVAEIILHPDYGYSLHTNDIALLRLSTPAAIRPGIGSTLPIKPLRMIDAGAGDLVGKMAMVTGWGNRAAQPDPGGADFPDALHQVEVPIITNADCQNSYSETIDGSMLCAGYDDGGKDSCNGDSGGPLMVRNDGGTWRLAGLTSWGNGCAQSGYPGVYARMTFLTAWVLDTTGIAYEPDFTLTAEDASTVVCQGNPATFDLEVRPQLNFAEAVTLSAHGLPTGAAIFSPKKVTPPGTSVMTVNTAAMPPGATDFDLRGKSATRQHQLALQINIDGRVPASPALLVPLDGAGQVDVMPLFIWAPATGARSYQLEVSKSLDFSAPVVSAEILAPETRYMPTIALRPLTTYYWRVTATNACGEGEPSAARWLVTDLSYCVAPDLPISADISDGTISRMEIRGGDYIGDLDVFLQIEHTWIGDVSIELTNLNSDKSIYLTTTTSCGGDDMLATMDDEASISFADVCKDSPALDGRLIPSGPLSAFDGEPLSGKWELRLIDYFPSDDGTLVQWCLKPTTVDACSFINQIPPAECRALMDLYRQTSGNKWWNHEGWLEDQQPCGWNGVTCDEGHVAALNLINNRLAGSLPPSLGNLDSLRHLYLSNNPLLGGVLPPTLVGHDLTTLWYDRTGICTPETAFVGDWLARIPDLRRTDASCSQDWLPIVRR